MVDLFEKERHKFRELLSEQSGFLFLMSALLWAVTLVLSVYFAPSTTPIQGLAVVSMIAAAATGCLVGSYKLSRDLVQWTIVRTVVLGVLLMVGSAIYSAAMGFDTANGPFYAAPTPMGAVGIAGIGFLVAAVFGVGGFFALYFIHGPSGRESIEEQILDE